MLYKENYFIRAALEAGDSPLVLAGETMWQEGTVRRISAKTPAESVDYPLLRLAGPRWVPASIDAKLRIKPGARTIVEAFRPDVVFFNSPQVPLVSACRTLKRRWPNIRIVVSFTTTYENSARNRISLHVQHRGLYRYWLRRALPFVDAIYCVSGDSQAFVTTNYGVDPSRVEIMSLPGKPISEEERARRRRRFRTLWGIDPHATVFMHSGKMGLEKRTRDVLSAFEHCSDENARLVLAGSVSSQISMEVENFLRADRRALFVGFLSGDDLVDAMCAADMYCQPGSVSHSAQTAMCCGTPAALAPHSIYKELCGDTFPFAASVNDLTALMAMAISDPEWLEGQERAVKGIARERLDYRVLYETWRGGSRE